MADAKGCTRCGASILAATAARTGGLCMPCKTGTRESIEAGRDWHRQQRAREASDPFWRLWRILVHRVFESPEGFGGLSAAEQLYFAVGMLEGDVYNGGFDQYFFNASGAFYSYAERGLLELGAAQSLEILKAAKHVAFGEAKVPQAAKERRERLRSLPREASAALEPLDEAFWKDPDGLAMRLQEFARGHGLVAGGAA